MAKFSPFNDNKKKNPFGSQHSNLNSLVGANFHYTSWMAMCLGFLFIWAAIVSLAFIGNKIEESEYSRKPLESFNDLERISQIMFFVGQEMLFTVDSLVSIQMNLSTPENLSGSVNFSWNLTDGEIDNIKMDPNLSVELSKTINSMEKNLALIRSNISLATDHPLTMIKSYRLIFDRSEHYFVDKNFPSNLNGWFTTGHSPHYHLMTVFAETQNVPYSLFIKGMNRRFIELAYGTIYHIGYQLFNVSTYEQEVNNYFYYFYSSHELIENAFNWDTKIYHQYLEMLRNKHIKVLEGNSNRNLNRLNGQEYTQFVTEVVKYLLQSKQLLDKSLREKFVLVINNHQTTLYAVIAGVHLLVITICTSFLMMFIRNSVFKAKLESEMATKDVTSLPVNQASSPLEPYVITPIHCQPNYIMMDNTNHIYAYPGQYSTFHNANSTSDLGSSRSTIVESISGRLQQQQQQQQQQSQPVQHHQSSQTLFKYEPMPFSI